MRDKTPSCPTRFHRFSREFRRILWIGTGSRKSSVQFRWALAVTGRAGGTRAGRSRKYSADDTARYAFVHALYQNALYERISASRRIRMSQLIAETAE